MNKEIVKQINKYLDTQELDYMTTIFQKKKQRRTVTRTNAQLRTITDGEIIIEYDMPNVMRRYFLTRQSISRLRNNGYSFVVWKANNQKSAHIHIYNIIGLDKIDKDINREYKRLFLKKYATMESDVGINTKSYQPIAMEGKPHFKYGTIKEIVDYKLIGGNISNTIEMDLLEQARTNIYLRKDMDDKIRDITSDYDNDWFVKWVTSEELPRGRRNNVILKNLGILMSQGRVKEEDKVLKSLDKIYGHGSNQSVLQWKKWAKGKYFAIGEIMNFMNDYDISFRKIKDKYTKGQTFYDGDEKRTEEFVGFKIIKRVLDVDR